MNSPWENSVPSGSEQIANGQIEPVPVATDNGAAGAAPALAPPDSSPAPKSAEEAGPGNVDKIREILFGSHIRGYESRFARLEQTLAQESKDLRESTQKRLDVIETFVKQEIDGLHSRFKLERDERTGAVATLASDLRGFSDALHRKIADVDDHHSAAHHEMREHILRHGREINDQIQVKQKEVTALLEQRFHELRKDKTDRAALASLFSELSLRLSDEFKIPELPEK